MIVALLIVLGAMIALAIDTALEIHRRHRALRKREPRFTPDEGANR